jgi:hypothetical protein
LAAILSLFLLERREKLFPILGFADYSAGGFLLLGRV